MIDKIDIKVGILGCGEVGSTFAGAISRCGAQVTVYDKLLEQDGGTEIIRDRLHRHLQQPLHLPFPPGTVDGGIKPGQIKLGSLREMVQGSDMILSTVTTDVAEKAAGEVVPYLHRGHIYVDMNSTAPQKKIAIAGLIMATGADFVEGAILEPVGAKGAAARILLGGKAAEKAVGILRNLGLNTEFFSEVIGRAANFKMIRSIFTKGVECLLVELLIAARRTGIQNEIWQDITGFMSGNPFEQLAANWIRTHVSAAGRRYHEMTQVAETVAEWGLDPLMTAATRTFLARSASAVAAIASHAGEDKPHIGEDQPHTRGNQPRNKVQSGIEQSGIEQSGIEQSGVKAVEQVITLLDALL